MSILQKLGAWAHKTRAWANAASEQVVDQASDELEEIGKEISITVQERIVTGRVGGPSLAAITVQKKGHARKLLDTELYVSSIKPTKSAKRLLGRKVILFVVVRPSNVAGREMGKLVKGLEFGTPRMPARPHWRPALEDVKRGARYKSFLSWKWVQLKLPGSV
mgnify:CR=1 FL=1